MSSALAAGARFASHFLLTTRTHITLTRSVRVPGGQPLRPARVPGPARERRGCAGFVSVGLQRAECACMIDLFLIVVTCVVKLTALEIFCVLCSSTASTARLPSAAATDTDEHTAAQSLPASEAAVGSLQSQSSAEATVHTPTTPVALSSPYPGFGLPALARRWAAASDSASTSSASPSAASFSSSIALGAELRKCGVIDHLIRIFKAFPAEDVNLQGQHCW